MKHWGPRTFPAAAGATGVPVRRGLGPVHARTMDGEKAAAKAGQRAPVQRAADEREQKANERERAADEREQKADERKQKADERKRARELTLGLDAEAEEQHTLESIDRARDLLALSAERINRQEARMQRARARRAREQEEINRESAEGARGLAALQRDPTAAIQRSEALRRQARKAIENFAASEDRIARIHDELAASDPDRREEYQRIAEKAREGARRARETLRKFTD